MGIMSMLWGARSTGRGVAGVEDDLDQATKSKSLFLGAGGRTTDSDKSIGLDLMDSFGPYNCSTRSISSSPSGGEMVEVRGVGGTTIASTGGEDCSFDVSRIASDLLTPEPLGSLDLAFSAATVGVVFEVALKATMSLEAPFRSDSLTAILRRISLLLLFVILKSRSPCRISNTRRYGARSAELRTTLSPGGIRTIRWCACGIPSGPCGASDDVHHNGTQT